MRKTFVFSIKERDVWKTIREWAAIGIPGFPASLSQIERLLKGVTPETSAGVTTIVGRTGRPGGGRPTRLFHYTALPREFALAYEHFLLTGSYGLLNLSPPVVRVKAGDATGATARPMGPRPEPATSQLPLSL